MEVEAKELGLEIIRNLSVDSGRAEITLFEAARAHCAADDRDETMADDIRAVAPIAMRFRQSSGLHDFFREQEEEDLKLKSSINGLTTSRSAENLSEPE